MIQLLRLMPVLKAVFERSSITALSVFLRYNYQQAHQRIQTRNNAYDTKADKTKERRGIGQHESSTDQRQQK